MGEQYRQQKVRTGRLALVMLCILLVAVGVAYWLTERRQQAAQRATAVLDEIRSRQLGSFWGSQTQTLWFLAEDGQGRPVGWRVMIRSPADEGGWNGKTHQRLLRVVRNRPWPTVDDELWHLDESAGAGGYEAQSTSPEGREAIVIELADGTAAVNRQFKSPAPPDYVPEGLWPLVLRLTAAAGEKTTFKLIFNSRPVFGGRVYFQPVSVVPLGPRRIRVELPGSDQTETYSFDQDGDIEHIEMEGNGVLVFRRVKPLEVISRYPEAAGFLPED